jgi:hypothetical protein
MKKAVIFDIDDKKKDQVAAEMLMTPNERLLLCLNLMELSLALSKDKRLVQNPDDIQWIELKLKNGKSNS